MPTIAPTPAAAVAPSASSCRRRGLIVAHGPARHEFLRSMAVFVLVAAAVVAAC